MREPNDEQMALVDAMVDLSDEQVQDILDQIREICGNNLAANGVPAHEARAAFILGKYGVSIAEWDALMHWRWWMNGVVVLDEPDGDERGI